MKMSFNFRDLDLSGAGFDTGGNTLKPGKHTVEITEAELKKTSTGGYAVRVKMENDQGYVQDFINVKNKSEQAQEIGRRRLHTLLHEAGHPNPDKPGDIKSLEGLAVGVVVEQGEDWVDDKGETRSGGGKPARGKCYYAVEGGGQPKEPSQPGGGSAGDDDEIPFGPVKLLP